MAIILLILFCFMGVGVYFLRLFADGRRLRGDLRDGLIDGDAYEGEAELLQARPLPRTP
jgi:hypothetical protein